MQEQCIVLDASTGLEDMDSGDEDDGETGELVGTHYAELGDENIVEAVACSTSNVKQPNRMRMMLSRKM